MLTCVTPPCSLTTHQSENWAWAAHRLYTFPSLPTWLLKVLCQNPLGSSGFFRAWATCLRAWPCNKPFSAPNSDIQIVWPYCASGTWTCANRIAVPFSLCIFLKCRGWSPEMACSTLSYMWDSSWENSSTSKMSYGKTGKEEVMEWVSVGWLFLGSSACGHGDQMLSWVQRDGCGGDSD